MRKRLSNRTRYVARGLRTRLGKVAEPPRVNVNMDLTGRRVAIYFADGPDKLYQIRMWLSVFETMPEDLQPVLILRNEVSFQHLQGTTPLPLILAPKLDDVLGLYTRSSLEAIVYVNNARSNFQSLVFQAAAHIHVNHGESDKISMVSNQVKVYDRVFVAGQAATDRYQSAVAWLDDTHLIPIGRPQLDLVTVDETAPTTDLTLVYAPTWEGEDDANNYTSVDVLGPQIVTAMLAVPDSSVVYKPHPQVAVSSKATVRNAHQTIVSLIDQAPNGSLQLEGDIMPLLARSDLLVADVSSVGLDFLYLRPDRPQAICDRRSDPQGLASIAPISRAAMRIDQNNVDDLAAMLANSLDSDPNAEDRVQLRDYYFDGLGPGQSTERFVEALRSTMTSHTTAVRSLTRTRTRTRELTSGPTD